MRRYSKQVKANVRKRMSLLHRQTVAQISPELGIHVIALYKWRKAWRLQGQVDTPMHRQALRCFFPIASRRRAGSAIRLPDPFPGLAARWLNS
jgi:transposase-like protein